MVEEMVLSLSFLMYTHICANLDDFKHQDRLGHTENTAASHLDM